MSRSQPEGMLYTCVANESANSQVYSGMEDFKWHRESVLLLISMYRAKKSEFISGFVKKRDLWSQVASEMSSQGYMVNLIACEKKWHNLCATYRRLKECSPKKKNCWPYFLQLQELLEENYSNSSLNKDCSLENQNNCNVKIESPSICDTHNCSINPWLPTFPTQMRSPQTEGESGSCDRDISNMLSVTIEENLDHSHSSRDQIHIPASYISGNPDDFKWTHDSVMLLCSLYLMRKEQFLSGAVKKRDLWSDIALEMKKEGFMVTCITCEKKWHNLIATYKKVSMYSRKKTWPYLRIFQKIIEEQAMHSASCGLSELSSYPNGYQKDFSENPMNQNQFTKEGEFNANETTLFVEQRATDEFKWTHASVISLCNLYKEKRHDFFSNTVRKRDLWMDISREMNTQGHNVTWLHCEKKWYNLYATYKKVIDQNRKKTRIWSTWPYLKFFQDIFSVLNNEYEHQIPVTFEQNRTEDCNNSLCLGCAPSSPQSEKSTDNLPNEYTEQSTKKQCTSYAPEWFLEYCKQQKELEENRQEEAERRHQELLKAISIGNSALLELNCNLKIFLSKAA